MAKVSFLESIKQSPIKWLYTVFLAVLIALFFGLGVVALYPAPKAPEVPAILMNETQETESSPEVQKAETEFEKTDQNYENECKAYSRNASIVILILAVALLVISLTLASKIVLISDALLLGGIFTLVYGVAQGLMSEDTIFGFVAAGVGLLVAVVIGYLKFIKPTKNKNL